MQALQAPFSFHHGLELRIAQLASSTTDTRIHRASCPSSPRPPMMVPPGAGHLDNLLSCAAQSARIQDSTRAASFFEDDNTFIHLVHHSQSLHKAPVEGQGYPNPHYKLYSQQQRSLYPLAASVGICPTILPPLQRAVTPEGLPATNFYSSRRQGTRSLTHSFDAGLEAMTAVISAPGSPPELSESRSSKSSSYHSQFSAPDELSAEITNFEEIGLEDERQTGHGKTLQSSTKITSNDSREKPQQALYYTTRRPTFPELRQVKTRPTETAPRSAGFASMKRGFTSPPNSTIPNFASSSRQSSPIHLTRSSSLASFAPNDPNGSTPRLLPAPPSRRGSWQPRKTTREIEEEFHDSDDELPEDASLWNVPISPFPSGSHSARSSARGSPVRAHIPNPQPLPLEHVKSAPDSPSYKLPNLQAIPRHRLSPRTSSPNQPRSGPTSPRVHDNMRETRSKSWNVAMTELSNEARILSQNLEYHADRQNKTAELNDKWLPPIPQRSSAPSAIQLPPVQRGALDFMPISKEKEAILSRTRPSWLPPKDPKEEKKHLKEYQRMMAASIQAEKKKETKLKTTNSQDEITQNRLNRIWDYYVEPSTDIANIDRRVNDLCWRGISSRVRGKVWQRTSGNPLGLSAKTYSKASDRVRQIKAKSAKDLDQHDKNMMASFSDIERDAETAFPELKLFQRNGPLWQDLVNVCEAHACYRADIGHLYGIQFIAALLLLQIPNTAEVFVLLENCLNSPVPLAFQTGDIASIQRTYDRVVSTLGIKFPRLHDYLFEEAEKDGLGLTPELVFEPMFRTMFSNGLDVDRLCRMWDVWMFEGDNVLVKTAVAVLGSLQSQIFDVTGDLDLKRRNIQEMLGWGPFNRTENGGHWQLPGDDDRFVDEIRTAGKLDYTGR